MSDDRDISFADWAAHALHDAGWQVRIEIKKGAFSHTVELGDTPRPDLDETAHDRHWQRPDGTVYLIDSDDE